jgi:fluoroquinolone transport system ATP-binding protein
MSKAFVLDNVRFKYNSKAPWVLDPISLSIEEGTIFGLLGPSGAGKSTTQKILIKLLTGYHGTVTYFGKDLAKLNQSFYEDIGVGFEFPVHFNKLTGKENMQYFASLYKKPIDFIPLMIRVGLGEAINAQVSTYSKGMKMRLNFVRALLNDPKVLFLDEPTNGLDPSNARILKDIILEEKKKGKTIFISTHLMGDVEELCDEVTFISKGKVLETSSPKALKIKYGKRELKIEYAEGSTLKSTIFSMESLGQNQDFKQLIETKNIVTMHSQETSLDKIFIQIIGGKTE